MNGDERRVAPRRNVQFSVLYRTGLKESEATLVNISLTGAMLESSGIIIPPPGTIVTIKLAWPEQVGEISLRGRAVRYTPRGFAIEFLSISEELRKLVSDLD